MTDSIFSLILLIATIISGIVALIDIVWLQKKRPAPLQGAEKKQDEGIIASIRSLFPVLLIVFIVRSFLFTPFKIPSGSMIPTLEIGDYILVSKYQYGLRFPYFGTKLFAMDTPQRGDVAVFSSTAEFARKNNGKKEDMIKRVVGLPHDVIRYQDKNLYINGKLVSKNFIANEQDDYNESLRGSYPYSIYRENFDSLSFNIINYPIVRSSSGTWTVPEGMYFMMGDNRDLSDDSRSWGFVPEKNLIGKALWVWMHWKNWVSWPNFTKARRIK